MARAALDFVSCILAWCLAGAGVAFGHGGAALLLISQLSRFLEGRLTVAGKCLYFCPILLMSVGPLRSFLVRDKVCQEEW